MEKNKRVLILYVPLGSGHKSAANAIEEAFLQKHPDVEIKNINIFDFYPKIIGHGMSFLFDAVTFRMPFLYKWVYHFYNSQSNIKLLNYISMVFFNGTGFIKFIEDFRPDFIIATNPLPMQLISQTNEKIANILSANVCTDFGFHKLWLNLDVNYFFVSNESVKKDLIEYVKEDVVAITGIPVSLKIKQSQNKNTILKDLGLNSENPVILIVGGMLSYKKMLGIIRGITSRHKSAQFIVVAGRDDKLKKKIVKSKYIAERRFFIKTFGYIKNLDEYMSVADIILTKAGGVTVSECLVKKLPMVVNNIIPGQEQDNVDYIIKNKIGFRAKNAKDSAEIVLSLLKDSGRLQEMKNRCKELSKPDAAEEVADFVVSRI